MSATNTQDRSDSTPRPSPTGDGPPTPVPGPGKGPDGGKGRGGARAERLSALAQRHGALVALVLTVLIASLSFDSLSAPTTWRTSPSRRRSSRSSRSA